MGKRRRGFGYFFERFQWSRAERRRRKKLKKLTHFFRFFPSTSTPNKNSATKPDEIYNLGAQSHVQVSFQLPQYTAEASGVVS